MQGDMRVGGAKENVGWRSGERGRNKRGEIQRGEVEGVWENDCMGSKGNEEMEVG